MEGNKKRKDFYMLTKFQYLLKSRKFWAAIIAALSAVAAFALNEFLPAADSIFGGGCCSLAPAWLSKMPASEVLHVSEAQSPTPEPSGFW
jgi:hypothetical protein